MEKTQGRGASKTDSFPESKVFARQGTNPPHNQISVYYSKKQTFNLMEEVNIILFLITFLYGGFSHFLTPLFCF